LKFNDYLKELQRRHVVKAGIAYLVVAWLLVQVLSIFIPAFELGQAWMKTSIIVLALGFPIWLIIAWVYDFGPDGIKKTEEVVFDPKVSDKKNLQLNRLIIGGLSIALVLLIVNQVRITKTLEEQKDIAPLSPEFSSSIAVLAFDDMSPNKDQEYFSDGISEEILNRLANYKELKVISRTSSFFYKGKDVTIDIIGKELNVAYVLEGSVRKSGDTFRTTVQLIDAHNGSHIWSDTYDRKMEDALIVQDEIAKIVAKRLQLTLLNEDVLLRKIKPEGYDLYLQALKEFNQTSDSTSILADSLIHLSLESDPAFSQSWSLFSAITLWYGLYYRNLDKEDAISIGLDAAKKAIQLDSTNVYAINWLSNWQWHARQGENSINTLENLLKTSTNLQEPCIYAAHAYTRIGKPEKALNYANKGMILNPKDPDAYFNIAFLENYLENYEEAIPALEERFRLKKAQVNESIFSDVIAWEYGHLGLMYYNNNAREKALKIIENITVPYYQNLFRAILYQKEGHNTAVDSLLNVIKATPTDELTRLGTTLNFDLATICAVKGDLDCAFEYLDKGYDHVLLYTEDLWFFPWFKNLHNDPRWDELLQRLSKEFNYDYNSKE